MDVRSWRKVLLQWITECNFMEHNYFNIEQTNIDEFFRNFCSRHATANESDNLISFLETHYPDFQPHLDDENSLSASDYVYIYSMLLHFSCVKNPDEHFHSICQKLTEQTQQCIAAFFKHLLSCPNINKEHLRHAIAEVAAAYLSSPPFNQQIKDESTSSSSSGTGNSATASIEQQLSFSSSPMRLNGDSPLRTPIRTVIPPARRVSPPTPKSFLLEERTRELYNYKAQLETERYEKGLLELQIKQNEQQILTLNQVQKKLHQQIQTLKDEVLNQSVEPKRSEEEDEQLKRRLYRQINEREDEIFRLNEKIRNLSEEKTLLENKMKHAERKLMDYRETIYELELKLNEVTNELEKKESTIKCLTNDKAELEHFIVESRTASGSLRPDFNSSNDCLDSSFARHTNSSSSLDSPENLGASVVDVQLREKEHENAQLRDELSEMRSYNKKLYSLIQDKIKLYKSEYNFEIVNAGSMADDDEDPDPAAEFNSFLDCMNHLGKSYEKAKSVIKILESEVSSLKQTNSEFRVQIDASADEIKHLKESLKNSDHKCHKYKMQIENIEQLKTELAQNFDTAVQDYENKLKENAHSQENLKNYIDGLNEKIRLQMSKIESLDKMERKLDTDNKELEKRCEELSEQLHQFQVLNQTLQDTVDLQNSKLECHVDAERLVKKKYEALLVQNEEILSKSREANSHLEVMSEDIKTKEAELTKMGKQIVQLGKANSELEDRIVKLTRNFDGEKSKSNAEIQNLRKIQAQLKSELEEKCCDLKRVRSEMNHLGKSIESLYYQLVVKNDDGITKDNGCTLQMQMNKILETIASILKDRKDKTKKILEMEKHSMDKLKELGCKMRAQADYNDRILSQHKTEIERMNERLEKAKCTTERLEKSMNEMRENHKNEILKEQKRIEELGNIIDDMNSKQALLKDQQREEERQWQSKREQLEAELSGEKKALESKDADLERAKQKIESHEIKLKELRKSHEELTQTISDYEDQVKTLSKENATLKNKLFAKTEILEEKTNELTLQTKKYEETIQNLKAAELKINELKSTLSHAESEHAKQLSEHEEKIKILKQEKTHIEKSLKEEKNLLSSKIRELEDLNREMEKTLEQLKELENQRDEIKKNLKSVQNDFKTIKRDSEEKIEQYSEDYKELQNRMRALQEDHKKAIATKVRELENSAKELNKTAQQLKSAQLNCDELQRNIDSLQHDLGMKIKELTKENTELVTSKQKLELNLENETAARQQQQQEVENLKQEIQTLENRQADFKQKITKLEEDAKTLRSQNEQSLALIEKLQEIKCASEARLLKAEEDLNALTLELEKSTKMLNERNDKIRECQEMLTVASQKFEEKTKIWESLKATCSKQSEELEILRKKLSGLEEIRQKQSKELESLKSLKKNQTEKLTACNEKIKSLNEHNIKCIKHEKELQVQLQNTTKQLRTLQNDYKSVAQELEQVSKDNADKMEMLKDLEKAKHEWDALVKVKDLHVEQLRDLLKDTEGCLKSVNNECTKLQTEILAKEADIRCAKDEIKQIQENSKAELDKVQRTVKDMEEAITHVVKLLENMGKSTKESSKDCDDIPCIKALKASVNKVLQSIYENQTSLKSIPSLESQVNKLNSQSAEARAECEKIKIDLKSAKQMIEMLKDEKSSLERKINAENERLENLEKVNEALSNENATLQLKFSNIEGDLSTAQINYAMLNALNDRLKKTAHSIEEEYTKTIDSLNAEKQSLAEKIAENEAAAKKLEQKCSELERNRDETRNLLEASLQQTQRELKDAIAEKQRQQQDLCAEKEACAGLVSKCQHLNNKNNELSNQSAELQKECINLRAELAAAKEKYARVNEELTSTKALLDEAKGSNNKNSERIMELKAEQQKLEQALEEKGEQLISANTEIERILKLNETIVAEKQKLSKDLANMERECEELRQTEHNLKQKIVLSDVEKDDWRRQRKLLETQVEINSRYQTTSESKLKSIVETSQALERNLLSSQSELNAVRAMLEQSKTNTDKLSDENKKLRDSCDALTKRLEKMALKLGDTQAQSDKLQRENEKLVKASEANASTFEKLQRDKDILQLECKKLRDRLSAMERSNEQCATRLETSEKANALLTAEKQKLQAAEVDLKIKITKLENSRQIIDERLRKMTQNYEHYERENVNLNHQIGALNKEIETLKNVANVERLNDDKLAEMDKNLTAMREHNEELEKQNRNLFNECSELRQQYQSLTDQLSKALLALEISKTKNDQLNAEVEKLEAELKKLHQEKMNLENAHDRAVSQLEVLEKLHENMHSEKCELNSKIKSYEQDIMTKDAELIAVRKEIKDFRENAADNSSSLADKAKNLLTEIESLRARLHAGEVMLEKEQENNAKLRSDNQILQAKYRDAKQRIETEVTSREERIKENRLELEGKLEKMKNKMKALYNEEITKMKAKQDRETGSLRSEISMLKTQNMKMEEQARKQSSELSVLNERLLEYQKENQYLVTKLKKYAQREPPQPPTQQFKKPNGASHSHGTSSTLPRISNSQPIHSKVATDLAMEDEEGEIFNNTYLADMKTGRMSLIGPEELQNRNSLCLPHLKSSYSVQYDHGLSEDEVKDSPTNDDSMSALIGNNNSNCCMRKKIIGVTNYRKPGPPTPSKNGGRLSLGGSTSEPQREILKESFDDNMHSTSSGKTPARFGFFSSRFSMGNTNNASTVRDEYGGEAPENPRQLEQQQCSYIQQDRFLQTPLPPPPPIREMNNNDNDLRRTLQKRILGNLNKNEATYSTSTKICTSTPRKSRGRKSLDKRRRLINEIKKESPDSTTIGNASISPQDITPPEISAIETPTLNNNDRKNSGRRQSSSSSTFVKTKITNSKKGKIASACSSSNGRSIVELERRIRKRPKPEQGARPSLCIHKNLYSSKSCTPQRSVIRDLKRIIGRRQRMLRFDKHRMVMNTSSSSVGGSDDLGGSETELEEETEMIYEQIAANTSIDGQTYAVNNNSNTNNKFKTIVVVKNDDNSESTVLSDNNHLLDTAAVNTEKIGSYQDNVSSQSIISDNTRTFAVAADTTELNKFSDELEKLQANTMCHQYDGNTSSSRFEQLLKETVSEAPFRIRNIRLSSIGNTTRSDSGGDGGVTSTEISACDDRKSEQYSNTKFNEMSTAMLANSKNSNLSTPRHYNGGTFKAVTTATPHESSALSPSSMLSSSRIIYGASVIFNRRIPNVGSLGVRKSSIYFRNPKCSTFRASCGGLSAIDSNDTNTGVGVGGFSHEEGDVILVTNQTITLYDLICMWNQMNVWTRIVVGIVLTMSIGAISILCYIFWFRS